MTPNKSSGHSSRRHRTRSGTKQMHVFAADVPMHKLLHNVWGPSGLVFLREDGERVNGFVVTRYMEQIEVRLSANVWRHREHTIAPARAKGPLLRDGSNCR